MQAVLPLQRAALAGRRPDADHAAREPPEGTQPRLGARRQPRRDLDARQVGVPLVRGLGPGVSHDHPEPRRSRIRQGAAAPDHARVVHEPERPAARLRVGLRRCQPAGARVRRAAGVHQRRRDRLHLAGADLPQDAARVHVVGERQGSRGRSPVRGRVPRDGQRRPVRSLGAAAAGAGARAGRRHRLDGALLPEHAGDLAGAGRERQRLRGRCRQVLRALRDDRRGDQRPGSVGRVRRLLLRPGSPGLRRHRVSGPRPVDDRTAAAVRGRQRAAGSGSSRSASSRPRSGDSSSCTRSTRRRFSPRPETRRW